MQVLVSILSALLLQSPVALAELGADAAALNGVWKSSKAEKHLHDNWFTTSVIIKYPNFQYSIQKFTSKDNKTNVEERIIEGQLTAIRKSKLNDKVYELDIDVTKAAAIFKSQKQIEDNLAEACAKVNVPLNLLKDACGSLNRYKDQKKLFDTVMLLDKDTILHAAWTTYPNTEKNRPFRMYINPLKRVL